MIYTLSIYKQYYNINIRENKTTNRLGHLYILYVKKVNDCVIYGQDPPYQTNYSHCIGINNCQQR